mmetsp:Transcript_48931/g.49684  ORF Transcript_48931/g.49684 Transcript_48931/m.49684 type:complete len:88 (+) Transcript_48931:872-1135(+)
MSTASGKKNRQRTGCHIVIERERDCSFITTKIGYKEECREQDQRQVQNQICEEEGAQEQSPGPGQGHPERSLGGEGDSVSIVTLSAP